MTAETEFILQCNPNSFIEQVMYSRNVFNAEALLNQPLLFCITPDYLEAGRRFMEAIRWNGKAENFELEIQLEQGKYLFSFSGVMLRNHIILVAQLPEESTEEGELVSEITVDEEENSLVVTPENLETGTQAEVNVWDLLEEMSRLNNELINTKRELIRKNMELERLQQQIKEG